MAFRQCDLIACGTANSIANGNHIHRKLNNIGLPPKLNKIIKQIINEAKIKKAIAESPYINEISLSSVHKTKKNECDDICLTPKCVHEASRILSLMDQTVDACDDFYSFACGKFVKETIKPDDEKVSASTFLTTDEQVLEQIRPLLREEIDPNDSKVFNLPKKFYKACMNTTLIEDLGLRPVLDITDKLGGWPVLKGDEWDTQSEWNWTWAIKEFRKVGFSTDYIFSLSLLDDSPIILGVSQAALGLSRTYLSKGFDNKLVKEYYDYMVDLAVIYGAHRGQAERELKESLEFQIKLANISLSSDDQINNTYLYKPLREIQPLYPYIQWVEYINALLPPPWSTDENLYLYVDGPYYFEKLGQLLQETPNRTIANYMMFRVTEFSSFFLTNKLRSRQSVYRTNVYGAQEQWPRWKECTAITRQYFPVAVGALYLQKYFRQDTKLVLEMVDRIRKELELILNDASWMDNDTRQSAIKKLKAMSTYVGYTEEIMNISKIEKYYGNLDTDENDYLASYLNMEIFIDEKFQYLKPLNETIWIEHASETDVNAFYFTYENSIDIQAGIIQGHFFSSERPQYLNYGAIGTVIGHEITHGFDNKGSRFDFNGSLVDWWKPETKSHFSEKVKCIIEQYGNFTEPLTGLQLNGTKTQGEDIADNGGVKESYLAYERWEKEHGPERRLPALNYSPKQMFWLSTAQSWCSIYRPDVIKLQIELDVHSLGEFRVLGPLRNSKEFAKDFNCQIGSPMNPINKCEVW
ncbi:neprilysin-2-like [Contarinia nasturtii]|uniref:neprilysin-2-like n=1 Tax=Contarinia nasturtii TaxID=265458 RepID=UPI0012D3821C|nr:neprilysin-2-like [Contarinia nasturtii]